MVDGARGRYALGMKSTLMMAAAVMLAGGSSALGQPSAEVKALAEKAAAVAPDARQVEWQKLEFTMFIHFGMNTFTNREWGEGNEDPRVFNPTELNADQWAQTAVDAGMRAIILVAKHHDGFCLWPSKFTEHSVKNSPWRGGKGDLVREVSEACKKHGLKFGVYLSPADLHEPTYGQSEKYNAYFMNQLRELLTGYGEICEVWFDGATPKDKGQVYNYQDWYALIRELQPKAAIFGRGPDIRWVGNEAGKTRESEWSVIPLSMEQNRFTWPDMTAPDLGSLEKLKGAKELHWYPAETDTSIRPGWFWHADQNDKVRSLDDLLDCYYGAVGGNSVLLLNVPPDTRGRIHENDAARLKELGTVLKGTFSKNLVDGATASASAEPGSALGPAMSASKAADSNIDSFWTTDSWESEPSVTFTLPEARKFNVVMLQEHIKSGQRVEKFAVDVWDQTRWSVGGSGWKEVGTGTTIGYKKLMRIPAETSNRVRVRFLESRVRPTLAEFGLFMAPVRLTAPKIARDRAGMVTITGQAGTEISYTVDGGASVPYRGPFALPDGGTVKAQATADGSMPSVSATESFDISKAKWKISSVSDEQKGGEDAANAIDDDPGTIWHSRYSPDTPKHPHWIAINFGEDLALKGFTYTPRTNGPNGIVVDYAVYVSGDGVHWGVPVIKGSFGNIKNNPGPRRIMFARTVEGQYLKFSALSEVNGRDWASAAEIGVVTK